MLFNGIEGKHLMEEMLSSVCMHAWFRNHAGTNLSINSVGCGLLFLHLLCFCDKVLYNGTSI